MTSRTNNFDFLRVMAASFVVIGHHFALFDRADLVPAVIGKAIHVIGIEIFFAISGYLVATSWKFDPSLVRFFAKRLLRISPGLIGLCVFSVFLLGPAVSTLPFSKYFSSEETWRYLKSNIVLYADYSLPGVFQGNPKHGIVNGSLWSLPAEFSMYIVVALVGLVSIALQLKRGTFWIFAVLLATAIGANYYFLTFSPGGVQPVVWATSLPLTIGAGIYFLAGALFAHLPIERAFRAEFAIPVFVALWLLPNPVKLWVDPLLFSYAIIVFGLSQTPVLRRAGRFGDFSYGLYLYAFPVQQVIWLLMKQNFGLGLPLVATFIVTLALASLSWHFIEARCLRWKPGSGAAKIKGFSLRPRGTDRPAETAAVPI